MLLRHFAYGLALSIALAGPAPGENQDDTTQSNDRPSPVALIGARCIFCHGPALMLSFSRKLLNEAGPEGLDVFLAHHHAPDADARDAIVQFLLNPSGASN